MTSRHAARGVSNSQRVGQSIRPPRYRLLSAAARLPARPPAEATIAYQRDCPACGRSVLFTQVHTVHGPDYLVEDHDCG